MSRRQDILNTCNSPLGDLLVEDADSVSIL